MWPISAFAHQGAALWGLGGAFIYAGPRWVVALMGAREAKANPLFCTLDMLICLVVGAIGAAAFGHAFGSVALTTLHLKDDNAICALIGLFANRMAPLMVDKGSSALDSGVAVVGRVLKALRGTET